MADHGQTSVIPDAVAWRVVDLSHNPAGAAASRVTPLSQRLSETILADGPIPVSLYMLMCLHDPAHGYYATRPGIGQDFATAPETSQTFGEMIGLWVAHQWREMGSPERFQLVELGPGQGTMMSDMLRASRTVPGFLDAANIALIEASPALRQAQLERLMGHAVTHYVRLEDVPADPAIIVANEFLDCLPVRQFVKVGTQWRERRVGLSGEAFTFGLGDAPSGYDDDVVQATIEPNVTEDQIEIAPGLETLTAALFERFRTAPGCALFIDYGPANTAPGDTLRAYSAGRQVSPLERPGECDLTADVDFRRLKRLAERAGMRVFGPVSQGAFLLNLGIGERARMLAEANTSKAQAIETAVGKLVNPDEMGDRFKAICLASSDFTSPPGFEQRQTQTHPK
ncbi:MAG: SAM-dependent methyltransferase [Hyphomonadaceae bacterium]